MRVSFVVVTHFSSSVLPAAVASFRREAATAGVEAEVIVVDHSEDPAEAELLEQAAPERRITQPNRGYAAGLNRGIAEAEGEILVLGNPDLEWAPGSLAALLEALDAGHDLVGPQFTVAGFLFPPAELQTPRSALQRRLAAQWAWAWRSHLRREWRRSAAVWDARAPVRVPLLSGALIATRASTAQRIGPWDERYFLFFEETDWLARARRLGLSCAIAPGARVEHAWGHASRSESGAAAFAASKARYFRSQFGLAGRLAARLGPGSMPVRRASWSSPSPDPALSVWLASPVEVGFPAGRFVGPAEELELALRALSELTGSAAGLTVIGLDPSNETAAGVWRFG